VSDAIQAAKSSVIFAVMELAGGGTVMDDLKSLPAKKKMFSYGMTQTSGGIKVYKPGEAEGMIVPFAYLKGKVPPPFQDEYSGGAGIVIHDKFVVVDFNGDNPVVFTGSSNLAAGADNTAHIEISMCHIARFTTEHGPGTNIPQVIGLHSRTRPSRSGPGVAAPAACAPGSSHPVCQSLF
jgi:hypothetical protein